VLDADALNILAANIELKSKLNGRCVLTPHPGEMARLLGIEAKELQGSRVSHTRDLAQELGCWIVLKGARSICCSPNGSLWVNPTANPALATAGSGDVLSGVIAGIIARKIPLEIGVPASVFVHGVSGEVLSKLGDGYTGVLAGDIARVSSLVLNQLVKLQRLPNRMIREVLPGASMRLTSAVLDSIDVN
jgi:hydroxyethylthiazole kinase-like uncharacterized protein yjeF